MIFKKLSLKNFMSYSNSEIDFSGIHVACLTGVNGAGKSTLLDAITWTLWEEGRARTDELIKLGKDEMSCELEFFMEDELYRVYRSRTKAYKNSQGKSNLEFQIFNPKEKNWISLSKNTTRLTQDFIVQTLKMDYSTFVNSVYLRQGEADEFTVKKPNERKQILGNILGLEVYDKLSEAAKQKAKEIEQSISIDQSLILDLKNKISKENELKLNLETINSELKGEEEKLKATKDKLSKKEKELNEKKEKEKQIQTLEKSLENQKTLIQSLDAQLNNAKLKESRYKELVNNKEKIQNDYKDFLVLKETLHESEQAQELYNKLTGEKASLEQELKEKIKETEQQLAIYKSKVNDRYNLKTKLEERLKNENKLENFLPQAKEEINKFYNLQELLVKVESEGQELKHKQELLTLELSKLNEKKNEINKKTETLSLHDHNEPCPLCKGLIKDKKKVIETYSLELQALKKEEETISEAFGLNEEEIHEKRNKYTEVREKISNFTKNICILIPELEKIKQEKIDIRQFEKSKSEEAVSYFASQLEISRTEFQKAKEQIALLDGEISQYDKEVALLSDLLKSGKLVHKISKRLTEIRDQTTNLKYNQETHEKLKRNLGEKENIILVYNSLKEAEKELILLKEEIENLTKNVYSGQKETEELTTLITNTKEQISGLGVLTDEVEAIKKSEAQSSEKLNEVKRKQIILEQMISEIEVSKQLLKEKENKIQISLNDKKQFEILEKAFSKNGIQVAIIETVVPEIEKEANRILSKLTENQMHVALRTQREKKSTEGLVETLDIVIADDVGTRNYELYSGGEAFKIDFALRLALSRLLANRAGAKLQTLIIDEGFGSQDNSGKERLLEVIRSIESEFELILVVTHLDELKESFPTQIQVSKDEDGSKVKLVA